MDRFFLAMMVSAVLLLIVAADLLINGLGVQEPPANVASLMPASGRLIREVCARVPRWNVDLNGPTERFSAVRTSAHRVSHKGHRDPDRLSSAV